MHSVYHFGSLRPFIKTPTFPQQQLHICSFHHQVYIPSMPSLVSLAEELLAQAKEIERTLEENNIPPTSFDKDTLEQLPTDAQKLRRDLLDTSHEIRQLARGARLSGLDIAFSVRVQHSPCEKCLLTPS